MFMSLSPEEWGIVELSLRIGLWGTLCSLPFAYAAAWLLARRHFPGKTLLDAVLHLPLVLPPVVVGFALLVLFGAQGAIGKLLREWFNFTFAFRWTGAALAAGVMGFPLLVRAIRQALESSDTRLEQAAQTLGAGPWLTFFTVTLPLSATGVLHGFVLAFARALGEFGATITFVSNIPGQTQTLPLAIYTATQVPDGDALVWRLCAISVVLAVATLIFSEVLIRFGHRKALGYDG
ncbi:Molybdenum transport system permease protein ModB [Pandoraea apista]|uniref:Molybdenum transport system permease n=2 Tax=Pandoraea apista TaxID=93218 RepID=A0A5E5P5F5_9BURK|nr:Molybdenum transport system permease protein ModB [Pandoraea apista]